MTKDYTTNVSAVDVIKTGYIYNQNVYFLVTGVEKKTGEVVARSDARLTPTGMKKALALGKSHEQMVWEVGMTLCFSASQVGFQDELDGVSNAERFDGIVWRGDTYLLEGSN